MTRKMKTLPKYFRLLIFLSDGNKEGSRLQMVVGKWGKFVKALRTNKS